jgi:uncharacterized protein YqgC (DUF456 family)
VNAGAEVLVGVVIAVGLVGIVLPLLPGSLLVLAAVLAWSLEVQSGVGWVVLAVAVLALGAAQVLRLALPGRRLRNSGVPRRSIVVGGVLGVMGFFVIPVVGLLIGFVLGIYVMEAHRLGSRAGARASTRAAVRAVGLSILVELAGGLIAGSVWLAAVLLT